MGIVGSLLHTSKLPQHWWAFNFIQESFKGKSMCVCVCVCVRGGGGGGGGGEAVRARYKD